MFQPIATRAWLPVAACLLALAFPLAGCGDQAGTTGTTQPDGAANEADEQEGHDHPSGPHGGSVVVVGDHVAHVEFVSEHDEGAVVVYVLDADMEPMIVSAPVLNLVLADGSTRVEGEASTGMGWRFEHAALSSHDHKGRVRVEIGSKSYNVDLACDHGHEDHGHEGGAHGPHDGVLAEFGAGVLELKLHDDKGDLELWLYADEEGSKPFDLPLDTVVVVSFPGMGKGDVPLRIRNSEQNEDEDGQANIRDGKTNYFIFPGDTGADASWLKGADFEAEVVTAFRAGSAKHMTETFRLVPHTHHEGHDHGHDEDHDDHADDHDEHDDDGPDHDEHEHEG